MTMAADSPAANPTAAAPPPAPAEETAPAAAPAAAEGAAPPATDDAAGTAAPAEGEQPAAQEPAAEQAPALFRRVLKERGKVVALRQQVEQREQRFKQEQEQFRREREQHARERAELDSWKAKKAKIEADPWAFFDEFEVDKNDFARRLMNENTPVAKELAEERRARLALEKRIEDERKQREAADVDAKVAYAKRNFVSFVAQNAAAYPDVADADEQEVADVMWQLAAEHHKNTGKIPSFEMVASYLQRQEDAKRAKKEQRRQQRLGASAPASRLTAANPGGGQAAPQRSEQTGHAANGPGPRAPSTLTNAAATTTTSLPRPTEDATDEEKNAWAIQELRRAFRKDADS
jgi:hypothetical protein